VTPLAAALVLALGPAAATAPSHAAAPVEVSADQVHAALVAKPAAVVVDARSAQEYEQAHIPGAISLPAERTKAEAARLPRDRRTPLVFYCRGPG
jgi:rhodanese-related sulfurtransferase